MRVHWVEAVGLACCVMAVGPGVPCQGGEARGVGSGWRGQGCWIVATPHGFLLKRRKWHGLRSSAGRSASPSSTQREGSSPARGARTPAPSPHTDRHSPTRTRTHTCVRMLSHTLAHARSPSPWSCPPPCWNAVTAFLPRNILPAGPW